MNIAAIGILILIIGATIGIISFARDKEKSTYWGMGIMGFGTLFTIIAQMFFNCHC